MGFDDLRWDHVYKKVYKSRSYERGDKYCHLLTNTVSLRRPYTGYIGGVYKGWMITSINRQNAACLTEGATKKPQSSFS